jgi:hypothetical protein
METVWIVTQGEWEDYQLVGVFADEKSAMEMVKLIGNEEVKYYEHKLDSIPDHPEGCQLYIVWMRRDGTIDGVKREYDPSYMYDAKNLKCPEMIYQSRQRMFNCWAHSKEHAVEVVSNWRIDLLANNRWIE